MRSSLLRRVGLAVAGAAASGALATALVAPAAEATFPPPCHLAASVSQHGSVMFGSNVSVCPDGNFDNPVKLQQRNPSTGVFVTVASSVDAGARYQCTGTARRQYRTLPKVATTSAFCS